MQRIGWRALFLCLVTLAMPRLGLAAESPKFEIDA
jgi:hypothetical protein